MSPIPDSHLDILQKKAFAHLATLMPDGAPQSSPVWIDYRDGRLLINSTDRRRKARNLDSDPRVAISIVDPDNPYRCLMIRGRVVETNDVDAERHIDEMAQKYLGQSRYPFRQPGERRVLYYIEPEVVSTLG
ncbi:PPOX class F420-dependent oxidoreductase [Haliangium ochraceum]|uniref:PPOX class putative F420-dependent enzyme n=1 Tax=Haliangium ochraceum (strain DSM 14365 / JCM 11303 / SMP-2) TaxID=502025 RepID=D0LP01_HALO1|nr:PPOX class F420-dependent oxidoreductase [Haliangium ochraceum]ACY18827.1 PPOX class putative F420-dependent enzyme [Haliangium ochraceum DSM 14365]